MLNLKTLSSLSLILTLSLGWIGNNLAYAQAAVAMISDLEGSGSIQGQPLDILTEVKSGQFIDLAEKAQLVLVYFESGHEFIFSGASRIYVREDQPIAITGSPPVQRQLLLGEEGKRISIKPGMMIQAAMVMRNMQVDQLTLLSPKNSKTAEASPHFNWSWVGPKTTEFRFVLDDPQYTLYIERGIKNSPYQLPSHIHLQPNTDYVWRIEALSPKGELQELQSASFRLLTAEQRQQVEHGRPSAKASFSERLVYAVWLKQLGLNQEAADYFDQLAAERAQAKVLKKMATPPSAP